MFKTNPLVWVLPLICACGGSGGEESPSATQPDGATSTPDPTDPACQPGHEDAGPDNRSGAEEDKEGRMYAGADCMACHVQGGPALERARAPEDDAEKLFSVAGTVYVDRWGSGPATGVTVEITDAVSQVITLTTNSAGNFYTNQAVSFPFTARVYNSSGEMKMFSAQSNGSCNTCHSCEGQAGGKLYLED